MKIKNEKRFFTSLGILLLAIIIIILITTNFNKTTYTETYKTIHIAEGDTLWNIAKEYKKPNQDIREYVYLIEKLNKMENSLIYEGQELTIIIYEEV